MYNRIRAISLQAVAFALGTILCIYCTAPSDSSAPFSPTPTSLAQEECSSNPSTPNDHPTQSGRPAQELTIQIRTDLR